MRPPKDLETQFEFIEEPPSGKILRYYRVRDRQLHPKEFLLRFLPEPFSQNRSIVDEFHRFFSRFSDIPNRTYVPAVYSFSGVEGGTVYVLEEYVSGMSLANFVQRRRGFQDFHRNVTEGLTKVCEALHYANQKGIFHLCITPEDIIVAEDNPRKVKLVGFGAQVFVEAGRIESLPADARKRMAPEVLAGKPIGAFSDVYSLAHTINEICPDIFSGTDVLAKALSPNSTDRFQKARDFKKILVDVFLNAKIPSLYESPKPMESAGGLKPVADICLRSDPTGATVKVNGLSVGTTTETGLVIPWKQGIKIGIEKPGYEKETIHFTSPPKDREITLTLKPLLVNVRANPPGGSVTVNGQFIGTVGAEGLGVPWDRGEITVEKEGFKKEIFKFESVPTHWEIKLNLASSFPWYSLNQHRVKFAAAAIGLILVFALGYGIYTTRDRERQESQQKETGRVAALEREKQEKEIEIEGLKAEQKRREEEERERNEKVRQSQRLEALYKERLERERLEKEREQQEAGNYSARLKSVLSNLSRGSEDARRELSNLCRNEKFAKWVRVGAERGDSDAQYCVGRMYHLGDGVGRDYSQALVWYRKAANLGVSHAQINLGVLYEYGQGVNQDYPEAVNWYRRAAEQGHAIGQEYLGNMYEDGRGVSKDNSEAVRWYRKAGEQGNEKASGGLIRLGVSSESVPPLWFIHGW